MPLQARARRDVNAYRDNRCRSAHPTALAASPNVWEPWTRHGLGAWIAMLLAGVTGLILLLRKRRRGGRR